MAENIGGPVEDRRGFLQKAAAFAATLGGRATNAISAGFTFALTGVGLLALDQTEVEAAEIPGSESPKFRAEVLRLIERAYRSSPDYQKMLTEIANLKPGEQTAEVCFRRRPEWDSYSVGDLQEIWMCLYKDSSGPGAKLRLIDSKGNVTRLKIPAKRK